MSARRTFILMTLALLTIAGPAVADDEEARRHFKAGVAFLQDPDGERVEEAYASFKKAYELSKSPKVLGNLGLCAMKLERDAEAIAAFRRYLAEVDDLDAEEREQIQTDLDTLSASGVEVELVLEGGSTADVADASIHDTRLPARGAKVYNVYPAARRVRLTLRPGQHVIAVHVGGKPGPSWELQAVPGTRNAHTFVIEAKHGAPKRAARKQREAPSLAGPIVVMGIGAAALVAGGVLGFATLEKQKKLDEKCPDFTCPAATYEDDVDSVRDYVRATDFVLLGGGVVAAAGIIWLIVAATSDESTKQESALNGGCGVAGCGIRFQGRF
ncbi:MAG TPA: hypothetical protein VFB62_20220 [Polyangiaceae bacterium]|nr:hypothetical protein [Polyangiaceae bacterium]